LANLNKGYLDLYQVSTGATLRENNLKEIEGGRILDSEGVLVANKRALREQPGLLAIAHELIERLEVCSGIPVPHDALMTLSFVLICSFCGSK
jgi:hypothetical protein